MTVIIASDTTLTAPLPETPVAHLPNPVRTSDRFTGGDDTNIVNRVTDAKLGGVPLVWASSGGVGILGGKLAAPAAAGTGIAVVPLTSVDVQVEVTIDTLPASGGILTLLVRAADTTSSNSNSAYRAQIDGSGKVTIARRSGGVNTVLNPDVATVHAGDRVAWRAVGSALTLSINGAAAWTGTDSVITSGSYIGIVSASDSAWRVSDLVAREVTDSTRL